MRISIPSLVLSVILLFLSLIVLPIYFVSIINYRDDLNTVQTASRNFIDRAIDTKEITEDMVADLNLQLASCNSTFTYTVSKEVKVTNPKGDGSGEVVTTWIYTDVNDGLVGTTFASGDFVTITVRQVGISVFQRLSSGFLGTQYHTRECNLSGMVR